MIISASITTQDILKEFVSDFNLEVAGPYKTVDAGSMYLRREVVDAIIFDSNINDMEYRSFKQLLNSDAAKIPVIFFGPIMEDIAHDQIYYSSLPIKPLELKKIISKILVINGGEEKEIDVVIAFINGIITRIMEMLPKQSGAEINKIIDEELRTLAFRNSEILRKSRESKSLQLLSHENVDTTNLMVHVSMMFEEIAQGINTIIEDDWGLSLIIDAMQSELLNMEIKPPAILNLAENIGMDMQEFNRSLDLLKPRITAHDIPVISAFVTLSDLGPELVDKVADNEELNEIFDDMLASQIITLVGQGSQYHQGLFGPIPTPVPGITGIIYSRILESGIKDVRMKGRSLSVLALVFKKEYIDYIPNRPTLEMIFDEFKLAASVEDINKELLARLKSKFKQNMRIQ